MAVFGTFRLPSENVRCRPLTAHFSSKRANPFAVDQANRIVEYAVLWKLLRTEDDQHPIDDDCHDAASLFLISPSEELFSAQGTRMIAQRWRHESNADIQGYPLISFRLSCHICNRHLITPSQTIGTGTRLQHPAAVRMVLRPIGEYGTVSSRPQLSKKALDYEPLEVGEDLAILANLHASPF